MDLLGPPAIYYSVLALPLILDRFMRDTIAPEAPSSSTFTELNVRQDKGKPHFIRLHDSVVKRLERQLVENPASTGLLLGSIDANDSCTIAVEQFEPTTRVEELIRARKSGTPKVVGYYRSHSRDNFTLDAADRAMFARCFPKESRLALFVKPPKGDVGTAMFFLGENGQLVADRATVEFPFNLRELGAEESPAVSAAAAVVAPASVVAPSVAKPKPGRGGLLWKIAVAGVVVIASVFGLGELRVFDRPDSQPAPKQAIAASSAGAEQPAPVPPVEPEITQPSKPEPAKPLPVKTVNTKPAGPAPPPKPQPAPPVLRAQRAPIAETPAPKPPVTFRQVPVQTTAPAPVPEAQLRPATPPPVDTERQSATAPVQSPKPVEAGLPYTPPSAIRQSAPVVSEKVRRSIAGEIVVRVRVKVDTAGKVIAAEPVGNGTPVSDALADSAVSAVKRWQFEPARRGGDKVAGDLVLSFTFRK
jgi:protein TonB